MNTDCCGCGNQIVQRKTYRRKYCDNCKLQRKRLDSKLRERENRKDYKYVLKHNIYNALYYRGDRPQVGFFAKL